MGETLLDVVHETRYAYSARVDVANHIAYLLPRGGPRQAVDEATLAIDPAPSHHADGIDAFGNRRTFFAMYAPHDALRVVARSRVRLADVVSPDPALSAEWRLTRESLRYAAGRRYDAAAEFAFASPFVARAPELAEYAAASFAEGTTVLAGAIDLMSRIHRDFRYDPSSTEVSTPMLEAFRMRHGVCQDFAHVMIGALRSIGLAARYVSGYLVTQPSSGESRLLGADASHAWVAVYCPQLGWIDLDPTNDIVVGSRHVTVAIGRDYGDVTPLRGVIRGGGAHVLTVGVSVVPRSACR